MGILATSSVVCGGSNNWPTIRHIRRGSVSKWGWPGNSIWCCYCNVAAYRWLHMILRRTMCSLSGNSVSSGLCHMYTCTPTHELPACHRLLSSKHEIFSPYRLPLIKMFSIGVPLLSASNTNRMCAHTCFPDDGHKQVRANRIGWRRLFWNKLHSLIRGHKLLCHVFRWHCFGHTRRVPFSHRINGVVYCDLIIFRFFR